MPTKDISDHYTDPPANQDDWQREDMPPLSLWHFAGLIIALLIFFGCIWITFKAIW